MSSGTLTGSATGSLEQRWSLRAERNSTRFGQNGITLGAKRALGTDMPTRRILKPLAAITVDGSFQTLTVPVGSVIESSRYLPTGSLTIIVWSGRQVRVMIADLRERSIELTHHWSI